MNEAGFPRFGQNHLRHLTSLCGNAFLKALMLPRLFYLTALVSLVVLPLRAQDPIHPMAPNADPAFEVSTIKPASPDDTTKNFYFAGRIFHAENYNVEDLIALGYGYHARQIANEPAWFASKLYDIEGVPDTPGLPNMQQKFTMIRKLLVERFHLSYHMEKRTMRCYVLTVAGNGPKLTPSRSGPNDPSYFQWQGHLGSLRVTNMSIPDFVVWFQKNDTDKPMLDHTNLTGRYSFTLVWSPGGSEFPQFRRTGGFTTTSDSSESAKLPSLSKAFEEQLGLKFESTRAPVDIMVIDHADRPSAN